MKENKKNFKFVEMDQTQTVRSLEDMDASVAFFSHMKNANKDFKSYLIRDQYPQNYPQGVIVKDKNKDAISGSRHVKLGVYKDLCISRFVAKNMVYCEHECRGVEIKPLKDYINYNPDIVIMVTSAFNAMRMVQSYVYNFGQLKNIKMAGMCAICQECTSYPYETNSMNISMLSSGTRCVGQWSEDELGIGFPFNYCNAIVEGLINTINPIENNKNKLKIMGKLSSNNLENLIDIKLNDNYYKGAYKTPKREINK
ncbi:DUF169 domain-containing protein [Peptostreptococcaceae bacterium AGR-M142]